MSIFPPKKMRVRFDEKGLISRRSKGCGTQAGYGIEDNTRRLTLGVEGMTCASCSAAVERALKNLAGIKSPSVLLRAQAAVEYDAAEVTATQIRKAISDAGYTPRTEEIPEGMSRSKGVPNAAQYARSKAIIAALCAVPEFYIGMSHMLPNRAAAAHVFEYHMFHSTSRWYSLR